MATSSRESRRRKILERGSDRLAFITGRIPDLPSPSLLQSDSLSHPPQPPLPQHQHQHQHQDLTPAPPVSPDVHEEEEEEEEEDSSPAALALREHDPVSIADHTQTSASNVNGGIIDESMLQRGGSTGIEPLKDPTASGQVNPLPYSLDDQTSFISTSGSAQHTEETRTQKHSNFFSPKQISCAIDASVKMRLLCSVVVAVLVVLSHLGLPLLGNRFLGSIVSFRPLYLVLLTNLTVVIARLLGGSDRANANRQVNKNASSSGDDQYNFAEQLSKTLELGLVAQKAIDAVFMDCSVYALIVICGLSLT